MKSSENDLLEKYKILQAKLRKASAGEGSKIDIASEYTVEKAIRESSQRHHYIPRYFIDGFLGNDGLMSVYNKQKARIEKVRKSSKGMFFENHRNSTDFGYEKPISLFEDAYGTIDNLLPAAMKLLRSDLAISEEVFIELHAYLNIFIVDLFWRNVNCDRLFDKLYETGPVTIIDQDGLEFSVEDTALYRTIPGFKQLSRFMISQKAMEEFLANSGGNFTGNLIAFPLEQMCIGDMPFIMNSAPKNHLDLINQPAYIPISKNKLYLRNVTNPQDLAFNETNMLNALIIDGSSKYICGANEKVLQAAVEYYELAVEENLLDYYRTCLFG